MALTIVDIFIFLIAFLAALYYYYGKKPYKYYENTKIKHIKPRFPLMGSMENLVFKKEDIFSFLKKVYEAYPDEK